MIRCHIPGLEPDGINCLKLKYCFDLFDSKKQDLLSAWTILRAMGFRPSKEELTDILAEIDEEGELTEFYQLCTKFLVEDVDDGENIHVYDHGTQGTNCFTTVTQTNWWRISGN